MTALLTNLAATAWGYDRKASVDYSDRYWGGEPGVPRYNTPIFDIYDNDCANFVSQTVMAGNLRFSNASGQFGQNGTMIRANELGPELTANHGASTVIDYDNPDTIPANLPSGDPVFIMRLFNASRTYWFEAKTHAMLLTDQTPLAFTAHTNNRVRYPIENIDDAIFTDFAYALGFNWLRYFHIPTGPVVKYVALSQVQQGQTKLLREYFYDDDYDPEVKFGEYYSHTYNGLNKVTLGDGIAGQGELRVKVIFDAPMDQASLVAAFGKTAPFTDNQFATVGWSTTHQPSDTWEGRLDATASVSDGPQTITIDGKSQDGSPLDSDGNLAAYNPGADTSVIFQVRKSPPPKVSVRLGAAGGVDSFSGTLEQSLSTLSRDASIVVSDSERDLARIELQGLFLGIVETIPPGLDRNNLPPGTHNITINLSNFPVGNYAVHAFNSDNSSTSIRWSIAALPVLSTGLPTAVYSGDGTFHVDANIGANSIQRIVYDPVTLKPTQDYSIDIGTAGGPSLGVMLRDSDGNVAFQRFSANVADIAIDTFAVANVGFNGKTKYVIVHPTTPVAGLASWGFAEHAIYFYGTEPDPFVAIAATAAASINRNPLFVEVQVDSMPVQGPFPIAQSQRIGQVTVSGVGTSEIRAHNIDDVVSNGIYGLVESQPSGKGEFDGAIQFDVALNKLPIDTVLTGMCIEMDPDHAGQCKYARDLIPSSATFFAKVHGVLWSWSQMEFGGGGSPVFEGGNPTIPLAPGVSVSGINASRFGFVNFTIASRPAEQGYKTYPANIAYSFAGSEPAFYSGPLLITLPVDVPAEERSRAVIVRVNSGACGFAEIGPPTFTNGGVSFTAPQFGTYAVAVRKYARHLQSGPVRFYTDDQGVTLADPPASARLDQAVNALAAQGLGKIAETVNVSPTGATFDPPALLKFCFPQSAATDGLNLAGLRIYQYNEAGVSELLANQQVDLVGEYITADVSRLSSNFNIFSATTAVPASDLLPPHTELVFNETPVLGDGVLHVSAGAKFSFSATDDVFPGAPSSGVFVTRFALDAGTPAVYQDFTSSVTIEAGTHTVRFFSVDGAGNVESIQISTVVATVYPSRAWALGADPSGKLWGVFDTVGAFRLVKFDGAAMLSSAALPGATDQANWSVAFADGMVYAIGTSSKDAGGNGRLVVYRASMAGALISSATYTSGDGFADFALDAGGDLWITGASGDSNGLFGLSLWRYCPHSGAITKKANYNGGGGFDAGFGVALISSDIWISGYSRNAGTGLFDLALWKFNSSGTLVAGPYLQPGYLPNFINQTRARIAASSQTLRVAAIRQSEGRIELASLVYSLSGDVLSEHVWRDPASRPATLGDIYLSGASHVIAGGFKDGVSASLSVLRYDSNGAIMAAQTKAGLPPANDAVEVGGKTWLLFDDLKTPYELTESTGLAGTDVLLSSAIPPASSVAFSPSTGPIGIPFNITGSGFGTYGGSNTRIKFGVTVAPVSVWNDTQITGTIPGLSTGAYAVTIERQNASSVTVVSAGSFTVTDLSSAALSVSAGPIGVPFSFTGSGFGPYAGTLTRVLVDGTTAPLSLWNDTQISGTIPGVTPGAKTLIIQRATGDGGLISSADFAFEVTVPSVTTVSPSSGPIGAAFTLAGQSFGPYAGTLTQVLIGGATAPLSLWNDATITGTVPGGLMPGVQTVIVERRTSDGGLSRANTVYFEVTGLGLASLSPSTGPIGVPFAISGVGFGAYGGTNTRVKFGTTIAALSLWNDTTILGTVPPLSTGSWTVVVERQQGTSIVASNVSTFTVTALTPGTLTPSSGPIYVDRRGLRSVRRDEHPITYRRRYRRAVGVERHDDQRNDPGLTRRGPAVVA